MHRRSIRLKRFDYRGPGPYFVTLVVEGRLARLGTISNSVVELSPCGRIVHDHWADLTHVLTGVILDEYIVMPDHFHGILTLPESRWVPSPQNRLVLSRPPRSLGSLLAQFKASTTRMVNEIEGTPGARLWQRNYFERVIGGAKELARVRRYITNNPAGAGNP